MSFIQCYKFAKKHAKKPLSDLDVNEIIKIEKLLKTEVRIAPELFSTNDVENFINAIKSKSEIIDFLDINSSFYDLLLGISYQTDFSQKASYDDFDKDVLRREVEAFLKQDIEKIEYCDFNTLEKINTEFGPTSTYQEISISAGWGQEFLIIAEEFDHLFLRLTTSNHKRERKPWWQFW